MPKIVFHDSDGVDKTLELGTTPVLIGRGSDCQVQTHDAMVSRKHARITWDGASYVVEDLGSSNGVFLGADKVQRAAFRPGDVVTCGSLVLRMIPDARRPVEAPFEPPSPRPAPMPMTRAARDDAADPAAWNNESTSANPALAGAGVGEMQRLRAELRRETERREKAEAALAAVPPSGLDLDEVAESVALFNDSLAEVKASLRSAWDESALLTAPPQSISVVRASLRSATDELERARQRLREMVRTVGLPDA